MNKDQVRILIPAAGYGRRVGAPPAKELLLNPKTGLTFIDSALARAGEIGEPVVISRHDKTVLNEYLKDKSELCLIESSREWPETLLMSKSFWREYNLVLLPDTYFEPRVILADLVEALKIHDVAYGVFSVNDPRTWGAIEITNSRMKIHEKPHEIFSANAWGVFSFRSQCGDDVLRAHYESTMDHQPKFLSLSCQLLPLAKFEDLTRP